MLIRGAIKTFKVTDKPSDIGLNPTDLPLTGGYAVKMGNGAVALTIHMLGETVSVQVPASDVKALKKWL
jgi:hypothetical protein